MKYEYDQIEKGLVITDRIRNMIIVRLMNVVSTG